MPNSKAISDRPNDLEGNWFFEWSNYPTGDGKTRGAAVLRRQWKQERVEVIGGGGGGGYFNRVYPFDSPLTLEYTTDFKNWGGLTLQRSQQGSLEIPWGSWDGHASELKLKGRDELRGLARWTYLKSIGGNSYENVPLEGGEVWRRALPYIKRVVFKGVSFYDYSAQFTQYDDPSSTVESETTLGGRPGRVEGRYGSVKGWGPDNDMRGNRPKFKIQIYGENLWGHHLIDLGGAVDLEPLPYWTYIMKGGGRYSSLHNRLQEVEGIELEVVIWPKARPGRYAVRVDGISIPFDLVIKGHPGASVKAGQAVETTGQDPSIFNTIITILAIFAAGVIATALFGPVGGIVIGGVLTGKSLWESYQKGGLQQVFEDTGAFDILDALFRPDLTPAERLRKLGSGALNLGGTLSDAVPAASGTAFALSRLGKWLLRSALGKGGSAFQKMRTVLQGRRTLDAARRSAGSAQTKHITQKLDAVDLPGTHKPLDKTPPPPGRTPLSDKESVQKKSLEALEGKGPIPWSTIAAKDRAERLNEEVHKRVYGPSYSKISGAVDNWKAHQRELLKIEGAKKHNRGDAWVNVEGEARRRGEGITKRIYVNAHPDHATKLMDKIVKEIVKKEDGLHEAKTAVQNSDRVDNTVLYFKDEESMERALKRLEKLQKEKPHWFRDDTPPMTERRSRGIATGDHPTKEMINEARKIIAKRLDIPEMFTRSNYSAGMLKSTAIYSAAEDVQKIKAQFPHMNRQTQEKIMAVKTDEYLKDFGIDPANPAKNLPAEVWERWKRSRG